MLPRPPSTSSAAPPSSAPGPPRPIGPPSLPPTNSWQGVNGGIVKPIGPPAVSQYRAPLQVTPTGPSMGPPSRSPLGPPALSGSQMPSNPSRATANASSVQSTRATTAANSPSQANSRASSVVTGVQHLSTTSSLNSNASPNSVSNIQNQATNGSNNMFPNGSTSSSLGTQPQDSFKTSQALTPGRSAMFSAPGPPTSAMGNSAVGSTVTSPMAPLVGSAQPPAHLGGSVMGQTQQSKALIDGSLNHPSTSTSHPIMQTNAGQQRASATNHFGPVSGSLSHPMASSVANPGPPRPTEPNAIAAPPMSRGFQGPPKTNEEHQSFGQASSLSNMTPRPGGPAIPSGINTPRGAPPGPGALPTIGGQLRAHPGLPPRPNVIPPPSGLQAQSVNPHMVGAQPHATASGSPSFPGSSVRLGAPPSSQAGHPPTNIGGGAQRPMPPSGHLARGPIHPSFGQGPGMLNSDNATARPVGQPYQNGQKEGGWQSVNGALQNLSLSRGFEPVDLLQNRHILPVQEEKPPRPKLSVQDWNERNCSSDIFRCTLTKIPENDSVLKKSRLPLGVLIHPFKDMNHLPVIQCATIVRCRQCRTYINPFVTFIDSRRWRCNVCYRVNEVPEDFLYDPVSQSYGDPSRRPECQSSTIEFIAPSEYMLRPPQPAVYLFCLDVSHQAMETGYVDVVCDVLLELLDKLPGDARTQVGFLTYDRSLHFYAMPEGASQPTQLTVSDIDDVFLPTPSDLLVNLQSCRSLIEQLLEELPNLFKHTNETQSALGAALNAAYKLLHPTGGRVSVFQVTLPNVGPGSLRGRETAGGHDIKGETALLGPETDFYKKLALECSGQQIAVDLFALNTGYVDLATLSGIARFSGGQVSHFPSYHLAQNTTMADKFEHSLRRYLTRKIGFEAVMRIRCTRGIVPATFHGHFFVRSTDLLALPNVNPDAGFGVQLAIEEELRDTRQVVLQAALLYTSSKGERRIRVHTLCLPVAASVSEVINACDQQAVVSMLAKFASERAVNGSLSDAKEGLVVSCVDAFETYKTYSSMGSPTGLLISPSLRLLPLYVLATLRSAGFRPGQKLDDRSFCFSQLKSLPLAQLMPYLYPELYRVDELSDENALEERQEIEEASDSDSEAEEAQNSNNTRHRMVLVPQPPRLPLSFEHVSATGLYLMDVGDTLYLYITRGLHQFYLERLLGITRMHEVDETMTNLPELPNPESRRLRAFVNWKIGHKPFLSPIKIIREDGKMRHLFVERMIEDRAEPGSLAYFEFLQHLKQQIK